MNKLRVYGCSFSCAFQDLKELPPIKTKEGWPQIVASNIGYRYIDRSRPGYGLNHILLNLQEDLSNNLIDKDDVIILSPSYFQRLTFPEIDEKLINQEWVEFHAKYGASHNEIVNYNVMRFYFFIRMLRELGYNIFGWCWSIGTPHQHLPRALNYLNEISNYLIYAPNKRMFWEDWILENPKCMLIPGERISNDSFTGDSHFSKYGHKIAAEHFTKILNINKNKI